MKLCREQCRVVYGEIKASPRYKETFVSGRGESYPTGHRKNRVPRWSEGWQRDSVFKNFRNPSSSPAGVSRRVKEGEERKKRERGWLRPRIREDPMGRGAGDKRKGIRPRGITMRSNVVNINETKVISVFLFFSSFFK